MESFTNDASILMFTLATSVIILHAFFSRSMSRSMSPLNHISDAFVSNFTTLQTLPEHVTPEHMNSDSQQVKDSATDKHKKCGECIRMNHGEFGEIITYNSRDSL